MARQESHFTISALLGIGYAGFGVIALGVHPEHALLAAVILTIAGLLPNIDNGPSSSSAREFIGFCAAIVPLILLERYPGLKAAGIARVALVVICSYLVARVLTARLIFRMTVHRGMIHSIPAAIITAELIYLIFWDLLWQDRLFVAVGCLIGFLSHLVLDATTNFEVVGTGSKKPPVMKLAGRSTFETTALYGTAMVLGWFVLRDIYPQLSMSVNISR